MLYNTIYTQRAPDRLKATGVEIADADIKRLSPLGTDRVNPHRPLRIALPERLHDKSAYRPVAAAGNARAAWMKRVVAPVSHSAHELSIAPKPVNDFSRGALVDDIVYTLALTAIQSRAG